MPLLALIDLLLFYAYGNVLQIAFIAVVALVIVVHYGRPKGPRLAVPAVVLLCLVWWTSVALFTNVKHQVVHEMNWSYGPVQNGRPSGEHVVLRYKADPKQSIGIISKDLADYLESTHSPDVRVTFEITTDFGRIRGYREIQIGERHTWVPTGNGYAQASYTGTERPGPQLP